MLKHIITFIIVFSPLLLSAQNQQANLEKYWRYRERMKNKFMVVSENVEEEGVNVPFFTIDNQNSKIRSSDNNPKWNHYLTTLATELWLLKRNNEDYSETLKELTCTQKAILGIMEVRIPMTLMVFI